MLRNIVYGGHFTVKVFVGLGSSADTLEIDTAKRLLVEAIWENRLSRTAANFYPVLPGNQPRSLVSFLSVQLPVLTR